MFVMELITDEMATHQCLPVLCLKLIMVHAKFFVGRWTKVAGMEFFPAGNAIVNEAILNGESIPLMEARLEESGNREQ
ncbi:hypothetical protein Tco_1435636 [Tanacetum coccineum]